jgi:hypothetical protein
MNYSAGFRRTGFRLLGAAAALGLFASGADAATVSLNGSGTMTYSFQYVAPNSTTPTVSNDYNLSVPGQYQFGDTFTTQQTQTLGTSSVGSYSFQDSYRFTVGAAATGDTLVASLGLPPTFNMTNLQFRLYQVASATTQPIVGGIPAGSTLVTAWMGPPSGQTSVTASFSGIKSGQTYMLDVAGTASGTNGGNYVGSLQLAPVPLPAALWLLVSGLGGVGAFARKRKIA